MDSSDNTFLLTTKNQSAFHALAALSYIFQARAEQQGINIKEITKPFSTPDAVVISMQASDSNSGLFPPGKKLETILAETLAQTSMAGQSILIVKLQ
jgi:hypothetical protein